jgi:tryptophanyl-tRNA synthetase
MAENKPILVSGVKPTGRAHIGNYFGAMRQFVALQKEHRSFVFIADYHALNFIQNKDEMRRLSLDIAKDYLALGLDPETTTLFKQSDIPEHAELAWIFDTLTTMPYLMRAHAYKDAEAKGAEVSVGTFNYPILMAADILLYDADVVPVGQDQKQHIEYARDTAEKFNAKFGDTFKLPKEIILDDVAVVPGTDGRKMSKSYGNVIPLFADRDEIVKAVMSIVTDSSGELPQNVYAIHKLYRSEQSLEPLYQTNQNNYKTLKEALIEDIDAFVKPLREKRATIDDADVAAIIRAGGEQARSIAQTKMKTVRERIGVTY